jgi:hypothetical protein
MGQLGDAVSGKLSDWSPLTGEVMPLRVIAPADPRPPFEQWWPDSAAQVEALPLDQIPAAIAADESVLALVPLESVGAGMRSLDVDGVNAVFGTGDAAAYPLVERHWVSRRSRSAVRSRTCSMSSS